MVMRSLIFNGWGFQIHVVYTEECKGMEKQLFENNGNTARPIPGPLSLREFCLNYWISFVVASKNLHN